jgi:ubiquinone/menaquinone biosynthesis C-methylase UbiE
MIEEPDWNERWKEAMRGASWRRRQRDPVEYFDRKAKWYNEVIVKQDNHAKKTIARLPVDHECTVLDIGSGPGTLSIPLAKKAKKITAIDPSKGMLHYLRENAQKEGLENITCINKRWEDVHLGKDIETHDIVIASHSLAMLDIKEALSKMNEAANRRVYILDSAGRRNRDYHELWSKLYGETYVPGPGYIYIVNVLYQMGIYANIEIWEREFRQRISSLEEAVQERLEYFEYPQRPRAEEIIQEHLTRILVEEEGALWSKRKTKTAMIWWRKETGDEGNA